MSSPLFYIVPGVAISVAAVALAIYTFVKVK